jgi:hypothetical protein
VHFRGVACRHFIVTRHRYCICSHPKLLLGRTARGLLIVVGIGSLARRGVMLGKAFLMSARCSGTASRRADSICHITYITNRIGSKE